MKSKINKLFTVTLISVFMTMSIVSGFAHGVEPTCEIDSEFTDAYLEQAESCKQGDKVKSYSVLGVVEAEDGIEKLRALLEHDCIEGFRNSIGKTIADDWAQRSKVKSLYDNFFSLKLAFSMEYLSKNEKQALELIEKLKLLVDNEWFTEDMRDRLGFTEFDLAFIKSDRENARAILAAQKSTMDNTPSNNAELFRFLAHSSDVLLQYYLEFDGNYSNHLTSSHIKDPSAETVVMLSGPGGTAWSYSEFNHAIEIIERLGLNWILVGDGVRNISLEDVAALKPLLDGLDGKLMFWISAHGGVNKENGGHKITLDDQKEGTKTRELFESLKTLCRNKAIDVILASCYSGAAYKDAIEVFSEGSRFLSTAAIEDTIASDGKIMLNGVDHFMKFHSEFNSIFELFSLGFLYKNFQLNGTSQIFASILNGDPFVLKLDKSSIDFEYVFENKEKIVNYLEHYLDIETLELVSDYIDWKMQSFLNAVAQFIDDIWNGEFDLKEVEIEEWKLSQIIQYAVGMVWNGECILKEGREEIIAASDEVVDCEKWLIPEWCYYKKKKRFERELKQYDKAQKAFNE